MRVGAIPSDLAVARGRVFWSTHYETDRADDVRSRRRSDPGRGDSTRGGSRWTTLARSGDRPPTYAQDWPER